MRDTAARVLAGFILVVGVAAAAEETATEAAMRARYERAAAIQRHRADRWVLNQQVYPHWIDGDTFWYKRQTAEGHRYVIVDADGGRASDFSPEKSYPVVDHIYGGPQVSAVPESFDLVILPQAGHELPGYAIRRMWDYFVRHLGDEHPPAPMELKSSGDLMKEEMMAAMGE